MTDFVDIALTKLLLWNDAPRIQTLPEVLSKIEDDEALPNPTAYGRKYFSSRKTDHRHSANQELVTNWPGLVVVQDKLVLKGIGLLEKKNRDFVLTEGAEKIKRLYLDDPMGKDWIVAFAIHLLTHDPRIRVFIKLLSEDGAYLRFETDEWFGKTLRNAFIEREDGSRLAPFAERDEDHPCLRSYVNEYAIWALGAWRNHELLAETTNCRYVGQRQEEFSLSRIAESLRPPCEVLLYLDILQCQDGSVWLDHNQAVSELGAELARDFGWVSQHREERSFTSDLVQALENLKGGAGLVVASELIHELMSRGHVNPEKEIGELMDSGQLDLVESDYGQSRHGEGLFGDPRKQLVKFRIVN